jgi:hypothetical protein
MDFPTEIHINLYRIINWASATHVVWGAMAVRTL